MREIILNSESPEAALAAMRRFFADWSPIRVAELTEEALQICAAAGLAGLDTPPVKSEVGSPKSEGQSPKAEN